jgi:hypothetical protein
MVIVPASVFPVMSAWSVDVFPEVQRLAVAPDSDTEAFPTAPVIAKVTAGPPEILQLLNVPAVAFITANQPALIFAVLSVVPVYFTARVAVVSNAFIFVVVVPDFIARWPFKLHVWVPVVAGHDIAVINKLPTAPRVSCPDIVPALAVPAASTVSPPAGTSSAAPTHRARISNRDFIILPFR